MTEKNATGRCSRCMKIKELVYFLGKHINFCEDCKKSLGLTDKEPELKNTAIRGELFNRKKHHDIPRYDQRKVHTRVQHASNK
jgi:hypothetical protein